MMVLGIDPIQRLVVPRVLACMMIAVFLNGMGIPDRDARGQPLQHEIRAVQRGRAGAARQAHHRPPGVMPEEQQVSRIDRHPEADQPAAQFGGDQLVQRHTGDMRHGHQPVGVGLPHECRGLVEPGHRNGRRGQPFKRIGDARQRSRHSSSSIHRPWARRSRSRTTSMRRTIWIEIS